MTSLWSGQGPRGVLIAANLSAGGLRILLLEATRFNLPRVGEFLSPLARIAIDRLGMLGAGWENEHTEACEFVSFWGSPDPIIRNFIFDPNGHSLVLNRARFDQSLAHAAQRSGARLLTNVHLVGATQSFGSWKITVNDSGVDVQITSSFLVMCCGRAGSRIRALQTERRRVDRLICLGMRISNYQGDGRPSIEAYDNGWTYSVRLPSGDLMINLCTELDAELKRRVSKSLNFLLREIAACPIARSRILYSNPTDRKQVETFVADASSAWTRPAAGPGWCFAGDQAQSMDPLSSSGIAQAVQHAELISKSIISSSSFKSVDLMAYCSHLDASYNSYLFARQKVYGLERRWPTPFWRRRSRATSFIESSA